MSWIQVTAYKAGGRVLRNDRKVRGIDVLGENVAFFYEDPDPKNPGGTYLQMKDGFPDLQVRDTPEVIRALLSASSGSDCGCLSDFGHGAIIVWNELSSPCEDGAYIFARRADGALVVQKRVSGAWDEDNETVVYF